MENVRIEPYERRYHSQVANLILHIQRNEFGVPITLEDQPDLSTIETFYQQGAGNFWIALLDDRVVGTIALIDIGNKQVALRKMFVKEGFRGHPYKTGQRLMDEAFSWMSKKGIEEVILGTLERFEAAQKFYARNGFVEVAKENLPGNFPRMPLDTRFYSKHLDLVHIIDYSPAHQPWFEKLNREWIEKFFWMEPVDFQVLQHPDEHIIKPGGNILFASVGNEIAGTVALKRVNEKVFEFTKMAVDEKFRGKKVGFALAQAAIDKARLRGADKIILYSNTILAPAISLYKKIGFKEIPVDGPYKRSNIKMELIL
ncbi:MAG TPA: GNAT family N-acetyltransferase [Chryseosolibacter sp.]